MPVRSFFICLHSIWRLPNYTSSLLKVHLAMPFAFFFLQHSEAETLQKYLLCFFW